MATPVLDVSALSVMRAGTRLLRDVSLSVARGSCVGVFGASASGKTTLLRALSGTLPSGNEAQGDVRIQGTPMLSASENAWRDVRGTTIAMLPQDVHGAFASEQTIGVQLLDLMSLHDKGRGAAARARALAILDAVGTNQPTEVFDSLPEQLSPGVLQQAAMAAALLCEPRCLVAENPVTHLDAVARARLMSTLQQRCTTGGMAALVLDSDPAIASQYTDYVYVLVAGEVVEHGRTGHVFGTPTHPFTQAALAAYASPLAELDVGGRAPTAALAPHAGCVYADHCSFRQHPDEALGAAGQRCTAVRPGFESVSDGHHQRCHLPSTRLRWREGSP